MSPERQYDSRLKIIARQLRRNQTKTELFLWNKLRGRQFQGYKFRRQFPIAGYILDFYCPEKKLAVELDGSQHKLPEAITYDLIRTNYLKDFNIQLLRFWDNEVLKNINGVLDEILQQLNTSP